MKNLRLAIKSSLALLIIMTSAHAKQVGRVLAVKGNVFAIHQGVTYKLNMGDYIEDFVEILTEENGQISFSDFHDHTYHVSGSGHIKVMNKITEIRSGSLWVQSDNRMEDFFIQSSNSNSIYRNGEFIVDYDSDKGKSELLVINGDVDFSNILESHLKYTVNAGQFSYVSQDYEDGLPRNPTNIGFKSFKTAMSPFKGIQPSDKGFVEVMKTQLGEDVVEPAPSRSIASVKEKPGQVVMLTREMKKKSPGKIIFVSTLKKSKTRTPASVGSAKDYFNKVVKGKLGGPMKAHKKHLKHAPKKHSPWTSPKKAGANATPIRVYGYDALDELKPNFPRETVEMPKKRHPAQMEAKPEERPKTVEQMLMDKGVRNPASVKPMQEAKVEPRIMPEPTKTAAPVENTDYEQRLFERSLSEEYEMQKRHPEEVNNLIDELKNFREDFNKTY